MTESLFGKKSGGSIDTTRPQPSTTGSDAVENWGQSAYQPSAYQPQPVTVEVPEPTAAEAPSPIAAPEEVRHIESVTFRRAEEPLPYSDVASEDAPVWQSQPTIDQEEEMPAWQPASPSFSPASEEIPDAAPAWQSAPPATMSEVSATPAAPTLPSASFNLSDERPAWGGPSLSGLTPLAPSEATSQNDTIQATEPPVDSEPENEKIPSSFDSLELDRPATTTPEPEAVPAPIAEAVPSTSFSTGGFSLKALAANYSASHSAEEVIEDLKDSSITFNLPIDEEAATDTTSANVLDEYAVEPEISLEAIESLEEPETQAFGLREAGFNSQTETPRESVDFTLEPLAAGALAGTNAETSLDSDATLQDILTQHRLWLESQGTEGRRAVFRDMNLKGVDFSHQNLSGASFHGQDITHCRFTQTELVEVDFGNAILNGADFTAANLEAANFQQVQARAADFSAAQLNQADFSASALQRSNFTQAKLQEANFRDADLSEANLRQINAVQANFRNANLSSVNFHHSDLSRAIFREANLTQAVLDGAQLSQANFRDAVMEHVNLAKVDVSQAVEIPSSAHSSFLQDEQARLQTENQRLQHIREELEQRERALIADRENLQQQLHAKRMEAESTTNGTHSSAVPEHVLMRLHKAIKVFIGLGVAWFVMSFILTLILQSVFAEVDSNVISLGEMLLMGVLLVGPLVLFVVSMAKCFSLANMLRRNSK